MSRYAVILVVCGLLGCGPDDTPPPSQNRLLIENARVIDGTGSDPFDGVSILAEGDRIVALGNRLSAEGAIRVDATGMTVVPGLIDAHVHLAMVPGAGQRDDSPELTALLRRHHLRAYLANGVTTVVEAGTPTETARELVRWLAEGNPGPRLLVLSPFFTPPGGYGTDSSMGFFLPPAGSSEEIEERFRESGGLPVIGVKVAIERGFGPDPVWPIHTPEMRRQIAHAARDRALPMYVHATSEEEAATGLNMGAHALMHARFVGDEPSQEFIDLVRETGAFVVPTFSIADALLIAAEPERLDHPSILLTVPAVELETATDPASWTNLARIFARGHLGSGANDQEVEKVATEIEGLEWARDRLRRDQAAVRAMYEEGVPVVLGSDSGNWPVIPYEFHGPTTLRELELMQQAGLTAMEVIEAGTRIAAEMLGIEEEVGTIEVGKCADLVILREDPLENLSAFRSPAWIIRAGIARTPEEWMTTRGGQ